MSDDLESMLRESADATQSDDVEGMLRAASPAAAPAQTPAKTDLSSGTRFMQGFTDLQTGLGQIAEHVAETPLNAMRWAIRKKIELTTHAPENLKVKDAMALFDPVTTSDFDKIVQDREQDYQQKRQSAQQAGVDWWRLGGQVANPINYLSPGSSAGTTVVGRMAQAGLQGAAIGAAQPSTTQGDFWEDKAKGAVLGGAAGIVTSGLIEAVTPALKAGVNAVRKAFGSNAASAQAAEATVNSALNSGGVDPKTVNLDVLKGMRNEVSSALEHGVEPSPEAIVNRSIAESLPYPVRLMRGQATRDAGLFAREQNLRGIQTVGEPVLNRLSEQNTAFVNNLDALGARGAPDTVDAGVTIGERLQGFWNGLQERKQGLYAAVRNSQGQPAMMDQFAATKAIRDALDTPQAMHAWDTLPSHIRTTIEDLEEGKLPLTVAQFQALDKLWGADARAADGTTAFAINTARRLLGEADIQDDIGQQARQAYFAARQAHAQQMAMIDPKLPNGMPNPQFQPMLKAVIVDGKPPESLFKSGFLDAAPSVGSRNLQFLSQIDPNAPEMVGRTLMGEIKRQATNNASEGNGIVSFDKLNAWANEPVKSARMDALLPPQVSSTFRNLARTVENAKKPPPASAVNTSNTGSAAVNAATSMLKNSAVAQVAKRLPGVRVLAEGAEAAKVQAEVQQPGVTLKSLLSATPAQAASRRALSRAAIPATVAAAEAAHEE